MRKISNEIAWNNGRQITLKTLYQGHIEWDYNMVGVVVAMVISAMHEKSCIDLHNIPKFRHSHISQSQWWNLNHTTQLST